MSNLIEDVLSVGISLRDEGMPYTWVLNKSQCLVAITLLNKHGIAVLGGDTYYEGIINPNGDSWYVNKTNQESKEEYIRRCTDDAINFVTNPIYSKYSFILVPDGY